MSHQPPASSDTQGTSTRPYLIRALHDWCSDNGYTPYLTVYVDATVQVPMEYVKDDEIVLNIGFEATSGLRLGNDFVEFKARFGGVARDIIVPVDHVIAIYARENGQGMGFPPVPSAAAAPASTAAAASAPAGLRLATSAESEAATPEPQDEPPSGPAGTSGGRPSLKRVK